MESTNQDETQPMPLDDETQRIPTDSDLSPTDSQDNTASMGETSDGERAQPAADADNGEKRRIRTLPLLIIFGLVALLLIAATSAYGGYLSGINERTNFELTQVAQQVDEQYQLGLQDLEAKRYDLARQRFEYVIKLDPNHPQVTEKLALVLLELNTTATPTIVPTPTLTPTPDMRSTEELFSQSQILLAEGKWTEAIDTLLKLRKDEPDYQTVKVDSMLYVALRNRGVDRILREGDLEGGTYDLALAEKFGPLDIEAGNMRTWADLYKTGASFWGLDWGQSTFYFGQIIVVAPNLRDNTNMTAAERFRIASIKYGDVLAANKEWCLAQQQYEAALNFGSNPAVEPTATWVTKKCTNADREEEPRSPAATPTTEAPATEAPPANPTPTGQAPATEAPPANPTATEQAPPTDTPPPQPTSTPENTPEPTQPEANTPEATQEPSPTP